LVSTDGVRQDGHVLLNCWNALHVSFPPLNHFIARMSCGVRTTDGARPVPWRAPLIEDLASSPRGVWGELAQLRVWGT
jgi:hypothetical protein